MTQITTTTKKLLSLRERIKVVQGGTSAGKTFSIVMVLIDRAQTNKNLTIDIISQTVPHLVDGSVKDFIDVMTSTNHWEDERWNKSIREYTFPTGSTIKFKSVDKIGKAKGPRRDILFLNEANIIPYDIADQLMARTRGDIWLDYNPSSEFWYHEHIKEKMDHDFIIVNYQDNEAIDENTLNYILGKKDNKNWWQVYGLGQLGEIEGRIYTGWQIIDEVPEEARLKRIGLDFGYTNDPSSAVGIYDYNGGYVFDEIFYRKGLSNKQIFDLLIAFDGDKKTLAIADSAEPKSIDELILYGLNVIGATKGAGSINQGIQFIQNQAIYITRRSINILKEYHNYLWMTDSRGAFINTPQGGFDHALDAIRYALNSEILVDKSKVQKIISRINNESYDDTDRHYR